MISLLSEFFSRVVTLSPTDSDQSRRADIRKLISQNTRQSDARLMLLVATEI